MPEYIENPNVENYFQQSEDGKNVFVCDDMDGLANPKQLAWVALEPIAPWTTSNAQLAKFANGTMVIARGRFTSTADGNTQPFCYIPAGFECEALTSKAIVASISGSVEFADCGCGDGAVFGSDATFAENDFVYFEFTYPVYQPDALSKKG